MCIGSTDFYCVCYQPCFTIFRFKSARSEIDRWQQAATQKDQQITQLQSEMQSIRDELRVRSEQVKAHEKTITNFTERNTKLSGRLAETEAKCERLEGEVNKVNRGKLLNRTGEQQVPLDQVSTSSDCTYLNCYIGVIKFGYV